MTTQLLLPRLRPDQWKIASDPAQTKVVNMGRRWGKTVMAGAITLAAANYGGKVAWVAPTYKNSRPLWRFAESALSQIRTGVNINRAEREIIFPRTGGFLGLYTADNPTGILGNDFDLVVIDEAARIAGDVYYETILPTLADRDGKCILISTPKGRNWFWKEAIAAQADGKERRFWTAPSAANPNPRIQRAATLAKERVPDQTYRQEWLAEFLEGEGTVFRGIGAVATLATRQPYQSRFVCGLDWGRMNDFTVVSVFDATTREQVYLDRFNKIDWAMQRGRIRAIWEQWKPQLILAEANSIGGPNIEALQAEGLPVRPFDTTAQSKPQLIQNLALAIEKREITLLNDPVQLAELEAYEQTISPATGRASYNAPEGMHDDTVIATALAVWAMTNQGTISIMDSSTRAPANSATLGDDLFNWLEKGAS